MFKFFLVAVMLAAAGTAHADNVFRIGYQEMSFDAAGSEIGQPYPGNRILFSDQNSGAGSSGQMKTIFLQWDFSKWFGVVYSHSKSATFPLVIEPGSSFLPADGRITGDTYSFEGRYEAAAWFDWFARVNSANFDVSGDYTGTGALVSHVDISDRQTYLSGGFRIKVSRHVGAEFIYHDFQSVMAPTYSLGLYFQF